MSVLTIYHEKILFYGGADALAQTIKKSILVIKKKYTDLEEKVSGHCKNIKNIKNIKDFVDFINNLPSYSFYLDSFRFKKEKDTVIYKKINTEGGLDIPITVNDAFDIFSKTDRHELTVNDTEFVYEIEDYLNTLPNDRQYTIAQSSKGRENLDILLFCFDKTNKITIMTKDKKQNDSIFLYERIRYILHTKSLNETNLEILVLSNLLKSVTNFFPTLSWKQ